MYRRKRTRDLNYTVITGNMAYSRLEETLRDFQLNSVPC